MRNMSVAVLSASVVIGMGGAVVAYELAAPPARHADATTASSESTVQTRQRVPPPRFAPCPPSASLERGVCVTEEVRTVVLRGSQVPPRRASVASADQGQPAPDRIVGEGGPVGGRGQDGDDDRDDHRDDDDHDDDRVEDRDDDGDGASDEDREVARDDEDRDDED